MNHYAIYNNIIHNAKSQNRQKLKKDNELYVYYENHHILPKCLNGTDDIKNLVLLTAKEHFIVHKLLTYIYKGNRKIACAYHKMAYGNRLNSLRMTARDYSYARELVSLTPFSNETLEKFHSRIPWNKGKSGLQFHSTESKLKMSEQRKGINNPMFGNTGEKCPSFGLVRSDETKLLMSNNKIGKNNPNVGIYEIYDPSGKYFLIDYGASMFVRTHTEYNLGPRFIHTASSFNGALYKGWRVKKLKKNSILS